MRFDIITLFIKKAVKDIINNRFLYTVSIITISLSILIVSAFVLFSINLNDIINSWKTGIKIMAYLNNDVKEEQILSFKDKIMQIYGVRDVRFISKKESFDLLKKQMKGQKSLFENLKDNPLPDAFEISMLTHDHSWSKIESLADRIESLPFINDVEYGQKWVGRFISILDIVKFTGCAMSTLFFVVSVFIIINTVRLALYTRMEEIEIMRLVGANEKFIKIPFYIEGIIQGAIGSLIGLIMLFFAFLFISSSIQGSSIIYMVNIHFLSITESLIIIGCGIFVGWLGCYISLKQFLKI